MAYFLTNAKETAILAVMRYMNETPDTPLVNENESRPVSNELLPCNVAEIQADRQSGMSIAQIAEKHGLSKSKVQRTLDRIIRDARQSLGMKALSREQIQKKIFSLAPQALGVVQGVMSSDRVKPDTRLRASQDILDRAGFAPVQKTVSYSVYEEMPREALLADIRRLLADTASQQEVTVLPSSGVSDDQPAAGELLTSDPSTPDVQPDMG